MYNKDNAPDNGGMNMDSLKMKRELESRLSSQDRIITYDREQDELRIESKKAGKGITLSLAGIVAKWHNEKEKAIDEVVYYVEEGLKAMESPVQLTDHEKKSFLSSALLRSRQNRKRGFLS